MNRPIKFRAWEEDAGFEDGVDMRLWTWKEMCEMDMQHMFNNPKYELMQYTGLKDKNGTEIYEGDIIAQHIKNDEYMNIKEVKFGCFEDSVDYFVYNGVGFYTVDNKGEEQGELSYMIDIADYEVIGNIYEHPHLLESSE